MTGLHRELSASSVPMPVVGASSAAANMQLKRDIRMSVVVVVGYDSDANIHLPHMLRFLFWLSISISSSIAWGADFSGIDAGSSAENFVLAMQARHFDVAADTFDYSQSPFSTATIGVAKNLEVLTKEIGGLAGAHRVPSMPSGPTAMVEVAAPRPVSLQAQAEFFQSVVYEAKSPNDGAVYYKIHLVRNADGWRVRGLQVHISADGPNAAKRMKELLRRMTHGREVAIKMMADSIFESDA